MADSEKNEELEDVLARVAANRRAAEAEASGGTDWSKVISYVIVAMLGALLLVNVYNLWDASKPLEIKGQPAPAFTLENVETGEMVALRQYEGEVVLLDFWATWCPPCKKQMPVIQTIHEDPSLENVKVLSINTDARAPDRRAKVMGFLRETGYTFDTLLDTGQTQANYGVRSIPTLVVVGPDGKIQYAQAGVHTENKLRDVIEDAR
jgi:thiol-disulfide isomerase/thioredoxin